MTPHERRQRILSRLTRPLSLYELARIADDTWPPLPQYPPLPDPVPVRQLAERRDPKEPPRPHRRRTMEERNRRLREACDRVQPQRCVDHFDSTVGQILGMTANGVKAARRRLGIPAKLLSTQPVVHDVHAVDTHAHADPDALLVG